MKPIKCQHVSCPPPLDVGEEVEVKCSARDYACKTTKGSYTGDINEEKYQDCECNEIEYRCKKEG